MNSQGFLENVLHDIHFSFRTIRKTPVFAATTVFILSLGIGGSTAMFSVIHGVLLKPLSYHDPDGLLRLSLDNPARRVQDGPITVTRLNEMRTGNHSFTDVGAFSFQPEEITLSGTGDPEALNAARVSANFLDILGIHPILGRSFLTEEDSSGGPAVAMISARLWIRKFGGGPLARWNAVTLNSAPYTIVGVLPANFAFPFPDVDVWVPRPSEGYQIPPRFWNIVPTLIGFARLKPQVTLKEARSEMRFINRQYLSAHHGYMDADDGVILRAIPLKDQLVADVRPTLLLLFGAVGFVLLIACANVASLLLARAISRSREFAVRLAIGASGGRLIGELMAESVVLSILAGAVGILLASWLLSALTNMSGGAIPRAGDIQLDGVVLAFAVTISIATGVMAGIFPAAQLLRPDLTNVIREGRGAGLTVSGRRRPLGLNIRAALVASQIALSIVLLTGAALLMESLIRLKRVDPGFVPESVLTMKIALSPTQYDTNQKKIAFVSELQRRVDEVHGVRGAAMVLSLPTTAEFGTNIQVEGQAEGDPSLWPRSRLQTVTPGYFRLLRIPFRQGRDFGFTDNVANGPAVAIINESFARRFWPEYPDGQSPVGRHMREGADKSGWLEIIGVVGDLHQGGLAIAADPEFYVTPFVHAPQTAYLLVGSDRDRMQLVNDIRAQVKAIDANQAIADVKNMDEVLEASLGHRQMAMSLLVAFAGVALLLATVGIYGVISYYVEQRTHELGIRLALGAQREDILRLILSQGMILALIGGAAGITAAVAITRVMRGMLFQISSNDPTTYVGVAIFFIFVALAASWIPARRAARMDPMLSLRIE